MGRKVAIDFGLKRLGIAISDESGLIAMPLPNVEAHKQSETTVDRILKALDSYEIDEIIVGNPLHLSGRSSFLSDEVKHFVAILEKHVSVGVKLWDERLSTLQAERSLREGNLSRKKRAKLVDSVAAVILLQSFLDSQISENIV
ncbi:MAG: Holliday junction resolvase RuvX [Chlamydiales bacterium]|nr:Holliday junction resolvase RuvX [Chlamydiales bacterium]